MKLAIPVEARFTRSPDGAVWVRSSSTYEFFSRYLRSFDAVVVIARVRDVKQVPEKFNRVDGPGVSVVALPHFVGPWQFARRIATAWRVVRATVRSADAVMLRLPGVSGMMAFACISGQTPFGVEVVGDPEDVFGPQGIETPLAPIYRLFFTLVTRRAVASAACVSYVTRSSLQKKYPASASAYRTHYSSVELREEAFGGARDLPSSGPLRCVTVGSLDQNYKGVDIALKSIRIAREAGCAVTLTVVGEGRLMTGLKSLASNLGVAEHVSFLGQLPSGSPVRAVLRNSDVFFLASRTEGLPRAMIEAMAQGLPALGSDVGGIPELLPKENLAPVGDAERFAETLCELSVSPERYRRLSEYSLSTAAEYRWQILDGRRSAMYEALRSRAHQGAGR